MDFEQIPFFPRYRISRCGIIIDEDNREISQYLNDAGYFCCRIVNAEKEIKIYRVHRLMALTFLIRIDDWETRLVNHLDGDKQNVAPENLEWSDFTDNNAHAYLEGLNKNGLPFLIYDAETDAEFKVNNTREATKFMSYEREEIYSFIKKGSCTPCKRWWFKAWNDERPWRSVMDDPSFRPNIKRYSRYDQAIQCMSYLNDVIYVAETLNRAVEFTGINRQTIIKKLDRKDLKPIKRWAFKFFGDSQDFLKYSEEELQFLERCVGNSQPIVATEIATGKSVMFASLYEFAEFLGLKRERASGIRKCMQDRGSYRGWKYRKL